MKTEMREGLLDFLDAMTDAFHLLDEGKTSFVVNKGKTEIRYGVKSDGAVFITEEKRSLMNKLYAQAIDFRRMVLRMLDGLSQASLKRVEEEGDRLDKILADVNGGNLPYRFEARDESILATAALISGDAV